MLLRQGISSLVVHSRPQRLRGDRWQPVQPAYLTHHHPCTQAGLRLLQRLPVSVAAGAVDNGNGGGSGEAKKPAHLCLHEGCVKQARYGKQGVKAKFCPEHAPQGNEDVTRVKCEHEGCKKVPSFGVPGGWRQFCNEHKAEGMVDLVNKRCEHEGCTKRPCYGEAGPGEKARFCAEHAKGQEGLVGIGLKQCGHQGCKTVPSCGMPGGQPQFCAKHKLEGMVSLTGYRCQHVGCMKQACYCQ